VQSDLAGGVRLNVDFPPHSSLRFGKVTRTPAMQAGLFDRPLSFREIFSWVPPPAVALPRPVEYLGGPDCSATHS